MTDPYDEAAETPLPEPDATAVDPDAPHGRNAQGVPYKVSAEIRARLAQGRAAANRSNSRRGGKRKRSTPTTPAKSAKPAATPASSPSINARAAAARKALDMPIGMLAFAGRFYKPLVADAAVLSLNQELIATTLAEFAEDFDWLATMIDKAAKGGKYDNAIKCAIVVGAQLATNHGLLPPIQMLGTKPPEKLVEQYEDIQAQAMGYTGVAELRDEMARNAGWESYAAMQAAQEEAARLAVHADNFNAMAEAAGETTRVAVFG